MEKEYKHEFAGVSSNDDKKFEELFDGIFDDSCQFIAVSKKTGTCYLGSKAISYKIVINIEDAQQYDDRSSYYASVCLVPCFKHLHKSLKKSFIKDAGENVNEKDYAEHGYFFDAACQGYSVVLAQEEIEYDENNYKEIIEEVKSDIANTSSAYFGLIGFYLDRPVNRIGENGWDYLRQYCNGVKMQTILKELKKRYL